MADPAAALEGARSILVERFAEDADLIGGLRHEMWSRGRLESRVRDGKQEGGVKFSDYFDFAEAFARLPSHRVLALFRGEKEDILDLSFQPGEAGPPVRLRPPLTLYGRGWLGISRIADWGRAADGWMLDTVRWSWRPGSWFIWPLTFGFGCGKRRRRRPSAFSPPTSAICCSPRRPGVGRPWALTLVSAPA